MSYQMPPPALPELPEGSEFSICTRWDDDDRMQLRLFTVDGNRERVLATIGVEDGPPGTDSVWRVWVGTGAEGADGLKPYRYQHDQLGVCLIIAFGLAISEMADTARRRNPEWRQTPAQRLAQLKVTS